MGMQDQHDPLDTTEDSSNRLRPWLTVAEVAAALAVRPRTVRRLIRSGQLAAVSTSPLRGRLRISHEALEEFLRNAAVQSQLNEGQEECR